MSRKVSDDDLQAGETVLASCDIIYDRKWARLTATDRRLLMKKRKTAATGVSYDEVEEIVPTKQAADWRLDIYVGRQVFPCTTADPAAKRLVDIVHAHVAESNRVKGIDLRFAGIVVSGGVVAAPEGTCPVGSVVVEVEAGGQIRTQHSVPAVLVFGVLGLAANQRIDERTLYLSVSGPGLGIAVELPADRVASARAFAARLQSLGAKGEAISASPDIPEQIRKLSELREAGVLTDAEFAAKKADLLARM